MTTPPWWKRKSCYIIIILLYVNKCRLIYFYKLILYVYSFPLKQSIIKIEVLSYRLEVVDGQNLFILFVENLR